MSEFKKNILIVAGGTLAIIIIVAFFLVQTLSLAEKDAHEYILAKTYRMGSAFENMVKGDIQTIQAMVTVIEGMDDINEAKILKILEAVADTQNIQRMGIISNEGMAMGIEGNAFDASDTQYFKEAMKGDVYFSESISNRFTGEEINVYSAPVKKNGEIQFIIFATRLSSYYASILETSKNTNSSGNYLINGSNGAIFPEGVPLNLKAGETSFEYIRALDYVEGYNANKILEDLKEGKDGQFMFYDKSTGERRCARYMDTGISDWFILSLIPQDIFAEKYSNYKIIIVTMAALILLMVLVSAILIMRSQRKMIYTVNASKEKFEMIANNIQGVVVQVAMDDKFTIIFANKGLTELLGYEKLEQAKVEGLLDIVADEDKKFLEETILDKAGIDSGFEIELPVRNISGKNSTVKCFGNFTSDESGRSCLYCTMIDVSEKQRILENLSNKTDQLLLNEMKLNFAMENSGLIIFEYIQEEKKAIFYGGDMDYCNTDLTADNVPEEFVNLGIVDQSSYSELADAFERIDRGEDNVEIVVKALPKIGREEWKKIVITSMRKEDGVTREAFGIISDITAEKEREGYLRDIAKRDQMTGLYNKTATEAAIIDSLGALSEENYHAMMIIDIDNFKQINDGMGHICGDEVIMEAARKIQNIFRGTDIVGRVGGDEFMVFIKEAKDEKLIENKAMNIIDAFEDITISENQKGKVSCSIGIASIGKTTKTFAELYRSADYALYQAKEEGKNKFKFYK